MSDNDYDLGATTPRARMFADITMLMLKGGAYGALLFIGVGLFMYVFVLIGKFLPDESKDAGDPTPWSSYEAPADAADLVRWS